MSDFNLLDIDEQDLNEELEEIFDDPKNLQVTEPVQKNQGFWLDTHKVSPSEVEGILECMRLSPGSGNFGEP